ncbi:MAG: hypothetical protein HQL77_13490 [Magnetococcales bacterium]|nr:hypothetical protein [Magnetococcales bacterium]
MNNLSICCDFIRRSQTKVRKYSNLLVSIPALTFSFFAFSAHAADSLTSGGMLGKDQALVSANNAYMLTFQSDSNLVLYDLQFKRAIWSSKTNGKGGDRVVMQPDGNLVMYKGTTALWDTNTNGKTGAVLGLGSDGNLVVVQNGATVWASNTKADGILPSGGTLVGGPEKQCVKGSCVQSGGNGTYYAVFQSDGNFVMYNSSWGAEWDTNTNGSRANKLVMQTDGNLVVYHDTSPKWASNTAGNPGAFMVMQKDKKMVIYNTSGAPIWSSDWNSHRHCGTWNIACRAEKTFSNLTDWVKDAAEDAKAAADVTNSVVNAVTAQANKLAAASASIAQSELNTIAATAKSAYASSASAIQSGYNASVSAMKSALTAALEAIFRQTGQSFINSNKAVLSSLKTKMKSLDAEGKAAVNRIQRAIPAKEITTQVNTDMKLLASKLGLALNQAGANIPNNVTNSSWSILLAGVEAGAVVGGETNLALAMNVQPDSSGRYTYAIVAYAGGSLGATIKGEVEGGGLGIGWSPGTIDDNEGWSVGFGVQAALADGGGIDLSWGVSKGMSGAANAIPGISLNSVQGAGVDASFKAGYTKILVKTTL